ncbi:MAG: hypothetical protein ACTHK4_07240, partial [Mycobacteriales bacterium]
MADAATVRARPRTRSWSHSLRPVAAGAGPGLSLIYLALLVGLPGAAVISQSARHAVWSTV